MKKRSKKDSDRLKANHKDRGAPYLKNSAKTGLYLCRPFSLTQNFFTWLIFKWMQWSINSKSLIVVQTEWMKKRVHKKLNIQNNQIFIFRPNNDRYSSVP